MKFFILQDSIKMMNDEKTTKLKNTRRDVIVLTHALFIALVAVALFLYGFFPIKHHEKDVASLIDIPDHVEHVRIKTNELYKPTVNKIIIMVIDALRWDFVTGPIGISAMPITSKLINEKSTCLMQAKSNPPTVTMPRIKAMMTGAVPSFIDIALNFGDLPVSDDSFLLQAKNHGHVINFYGDDTWLKIFPGIFKRYEGTTSFYVNDFTEVDNNVTRNIARELESKEDWSLLILHYLGLDHIGHVAGPFSPLIEPKLREMDMIIGQIHQKIKDWNVNGLPAIFVICGDHGMKDSGGHGGSTPEETLVPFFIIGTDCSSNNDQPNLISQIDIASTLSVMLGTPLPSSNIGNIHPILLNNRSDSSKLFVLYYNAQQILKHFKTIPDYENSQAYKYYKDAVELHVDWLTKQQDSSNAVEATLILYNEAFLLMKELLIHSTIDYDLHAMIIAMIFMSHIIHIMANSENYEKRGIMNKFYWIIASIISYLTLRFLWESENTIVPTTSKNFFLNIAASVIIVLNCNFAGNISLWQSFKKRIVNFEFKDYLLPMGTFVHITSLISSSFVEEEHQTWYFFWTTFFILVFFHIARKNWQNRRILTQILLSLVIHRVLRKLNSTGNKYAHMPDIANWLRDQENIAAMTFLLIVALGLLVWISYVVEEKKYKVKTLFVHVGAAICIYLRHMTSGSVAKLPFYFNSRGIIEVRIFWIIIIFRLFHWAYRLFRTRAKNLLAKLLLRFIVEIWIIISSILHRPQNIILLPLQLLISRAIHDALGTLESGENAILYIYMWMGNVFYFYQGNSNSLATIDVAAGYVGMESYRPLVTGIFLSINTYSAPVLAYLTLIYRSTHCEETNSYSERILSINRKYASWRFLPMAVYTIIVTFQRFHLFVWTVFSPKLLYESMHCAVIFTFILTIQFLCFYVTPK